MFVQGSLTEISPLSTVDLLVLTSLDQLLFIFFTFLQTTYLNEEVEEVNRTEPYH